jgi:hypothetical protein
MRKREAAYPPPEPSSNTVCEQSRSMTKAARSIALSAILSSSVSSSSHLPPNDMGGTSIEGAEERV